jgi:hypothetical protein
VAKLNYETPPPPAEPPLPLERTAALRDKLDPTKRPTPAPAWLALLAPWLGLAVLVTSIVFVFLPGSADPRAELQHARDYSPADRFLPFPIYGAALALFVGIIVLWQMRKEPRPLPAPLVAQRMQAWVGIVLALLGAAVIYGWVAVRGPR